MRRRGGGLGALKAKEAKAKAAAEVGTGLADDHMKHMADQLKVFKENLEEFAHKYKHQINKVGQPQERSLCCLARGKGPGSAASGKSRHSHSAALDFHDACLRCGCRGGQCAAGP